MSKFWTRRETMYRCETRRSLIAALLGWAVARPLLKHRVVKSRQFFILILVSVLGQAGVLAQERPAEAVLRAQPFESKIDVRVDPVKIGGRFIDRVSLNGATLAVLPAEPSLERDAKDFSQLPESLREEIQSVRRELIATSVKVIYSGKLSTALSMQGNRGVALTLSDGFLRRQNLQPVVPLDRLRSNPAQLKRFLKIASEAVFTSTIDSARHYGSKSAEMSGKVVEAGFSMNVKLELSLGLGGFNFSKTAGCLLEIGYNHEHRQFVFHYAYRKEKQSGGISTPGAKVEFRIYQMTDLDEDRAEFNGNSWYPPAIPLVSAVFDSAGPYRAQGLVIGFTSGDWIGLSVVNTENEFNTVQRRKVLLTVSEKVDFAMMTAFKIFWKPANAVYKTLAPPAAKAFQFGTKATLRGWKESVKIARTCQAALAK